MAKPPKPDWEARFDAFEKRMLAALEASDKERRISDKLHRERMERIDRRLDATSKLLQQGARILIQIEQSQRQLVDSLRAFPRNGKGQK